jgi:hypothetical protein
MRICPHSLTWIGLPDVLNCTMIHAPMIPMTNNLQLSGFVLFGTSQMMVELENSQWLRIPLSAFPALQNLHEDECLDYRLAANRTHLRWPRTSMSMVTPVPSGS